MAFDKEDNLFISDYPTNRIRKVEATTGIVTTIVGNSTFGYGGDGGPATAALIQSPLGLAVDTGGVLYFCDGVNARLREIEGGIINTFAGTGTAGFSGDGGNPLLAQINATGGVALDKKGNIAFVDQTRIRIVKKGGLSAENETVVPSNVSIYPNPSEGRCTLRIGGNTTTPVYVTITNVLGSLVARFSASTNTPIAINLDRHPGLYFVTATSSSGTTTRPLLID